MTYRLDEYGNALASLRRQGSLPKENYWFYVNKKDQTIKFKASEKKEEGWVGYFVEDDSRMPGIVTIAEKRIKKSR